MLFRSHYGGGTDVLDEFSGAVSLMANYNIVKGLSVGVGVKPTYYFRYAKKFDLPLTVRAAYDFDFMEVAASYSYGLIRNFDHFEPFKKIRTSELMLSVYVPLWKRK